jgi:hypothetical protein
MDRHIFRYWWMVLSYPSLNVKSLQYLIVTDEVYRFPPRRSIKQPAYFFYQYSETRWGYVRIAARPRGGTPENQGLFPTREDYLLHRRPWLVPGLVQAPIQWVSPRYIDRNVNLTTHLHQEYTELYRHFPIRRHGEDGEVIN